jgi:hypothetical protein
MGRPATLFLASTAILISSEFARAQEVLSLAPLHAIPTLNESARPIAPDGPARVRLNSADPQKLARVLGVSLPAGHEAFEYVIDQYPQLAGTATRTWLEPTFLIDFTEPVFDQLRRELGSGGAEVMRPQLVEYVADFVAESDDRHWDLASVVARRRSGDCSEHAVLTAALARMQGIPARVVVGVALISDGHNHSSFGHAWAELLEEGTWTVADAALSELKSTVRYMPVGIIEDEGMGYFMDIMRLLRMWIDRVEVLGPG